jgi:hypothetical protein
MSNIMAVSLQEREQTPHQLSLPLKESTKPPGTTMTSIIGKTKHHVNRYVLSAGWVCSCLVASGIIHYIRWT